MLIRVELLIEGLEKIEVDDTNEEEIEVLDDNTLEEVRGDREVNDDTNEVLSTNLEDDDSLPSMEGTKEVEDVIEVVKNVDNIDDEEDNKSKEVMNSIFESFANTEETYATYSVYILREMKL